MAYVAFGGCLCVTCTKVPSYLLIVVFTVHMYRCRTKMARLSFCRNWSTWLVRITMVIV